MAGTLTDEAFVRINSRITEDISNIQKQIEELDKKRRVDIETIRATMLLTNNIYEAYQKASPRVKRMYLSLFWEGFWVKDRQIIKAKPTRLIESLITEKEVFMKPLSSVVRIRTDLLRLLDDIRTYCLTGNVHLQQAEIR